MAEKEKAREAAQKLNQSLEKVICAGGTF